MTTREPKQPGRARKPADASTQSATRVKRPPVERTEPHRSGRSAAGEAGTAERAKRTAGGLDTAAARDAAPDMQVDDAVAAAVKSSYEVLSQTIAQGRAAAARFREGDYNIREVPRDFEAMARRLLELARQISSSTFDLCEELLGQISSAAGPPPPGEVAAGLPAFRSLKERVQAAVAVPPAAQPGPATDPAVPPPRADALELEVVFSGKSSARCLASKLQRPAKPTGVWQIDCAPLAPRSGDAAPIMDVKFAFDLARDGLAATVTVPVAQPPGIYSGLVYAETQDLPLGALVVEVIS